MRFIKTEYKWHAEAPSSYGSSPIESHFLRVSCACPRCDVVIRFNRVAKSLSENIVGGHSVLLRHLAYARYSRPVVKVCALRSCRQMAHGVSNRVFDFFPTEFGHTRTNHRYSKQAGRCDLVVTERRGANVSWGLAAIRKQVAFLSLN